MSITVKLHSKGAARWIELYDGWGGGGPRKFSNGVEKDADSEPFTVTANGTDGGDDTAQIYVKAADWTPGNPHPVTGWTARNMVVKDRDEVNKITVGDWSAASPVVAEPADGETSQA